ncbi:23S rRNA methyltransferase [Actinocatenispora thailandica]|uniref:23S rRNA methyltransferase n=1 Tax=Actinocatenispora thailandica TaxID=227318 RepID=A0A7R7HXI9_9ACTN|nr:TRAM domain-containing protein [Actinocatenispora thailandica]BCJ35988.1 23S rRNA methyltransferase [Actinocatenispora thailandica]
MTAPPAGPSVGDTLRLTVGKVAAGGHCVARYEGQVVFVRHALPGEVVDATVTEARRGYLRADAVRVHTASADRVPPPCRYAGPGRCGGCDWQHATPAAQRRLKADVVAELLVRLGTLTEEQVAALEITVAELPGGPLDWRTRVRYAVDRAGRAGLRVHRSHRIVEIDGCPIATPAVRELPVTDRRWPPGSELSVVSSTAGDPAVLEHRELPAGAGRRANRRRQSRGRTVTRLVYGGATVTERAIGTEFELPAEAFWQVHPAAADTFATTALDLLAPRAGDRAYDLYGGAGLFAVALGRAVGTDGSVTLVESHGGAADAARHNVRELPQVEVRADRVERVLPSLGAADLVLLDPPRSGAGRTVVEQIVATSPRAVCYVACDPAALARDTATFAGLGWRLSQLRGFDAFPMTQHLECIALFEPGQAR